MSVVIRVHPFLRHLTGGQELVEVDGHTTGECLENLEKRFPGIRQEIRDEKGQLRGYCEILLNSESTCNRDLSTPVKDGDVIHILFIVTGG